jgi:Domain of unknown function (DUF1735)
MKILFIRTALIVSIAISIIATGCLKDKAYDNGEIQSLRSTGAVPKVIEIKLTAGNTTNFESIAVANSNNDTTIGLIPVNLATSDPAQEDIKVTLTLNSTLVADYNTDNGTDYLIPSGSMFTVLNAGVVTIPKGSHTGYLQIKFKPSDFLVGSWAFGYTISSIDKPGYIISGNLQNGIVALGAKNIYDGHYKSSGVFVHPAFPGNTWTFADGIFQDLVTSGPNSVTTTPINTAAVSFGISLDITINPDNSLIEVLNGVTTPTPNTDHYDPATKTFFVSGGYIGGTGPRKYNATLTYVGPR